MLSNMSRNLRIGHLRAVGCWANGAARQASAAAAEAAPAAAEPVCAVGSAFKVTRQFSAADVDVFTKLTGDSNPIHGSEEAAANSGLLGPVLPGILMASLFPAIVGSTFPQSLYMTQSLTFRSPAPVNSVLTATVTVTKVSGNKVRFETACHTAGGALVLDGMAVCILRRATDSKDSSGVYRDDSYWGTRCSLSDV